MIALRWSERREREAIVRHLARCSFCRALLAYGRHRSDRALLDAAERLTSEHAVNDAERERFAVQVRVSIRRATPSLTRCDRRR